MGTRLNQLLQRLNARSDAAADSAFLFRARLANSQLDAATNAIRRSVEELSIFEFGAGADLIGPLTMRGRGVTRQVIVDLDPLVQPRLVADALARLEKHCAELQVAPPRLDVWSRRGLIVDLRESLGIDYRAPLDARASGLPAESFDLICSNSTMEHIPESDLDPLMAECRRLLKRDGVMCFRIDYEDHYAIGDRALSPYNFLRFDDEEWRPYNNRLHFQNRLRHSDYVALFTRMGLQIVTADTLAPSPAALVELSRTPIAERFRHYELDDLAVRKGSFVLRKHVASD